METMQFIRSIKQGFGLFYAKSLVFVGSAFLVSWDSAAQAKDVDPSAPLDVLKTARSVAEKSNMNVEDVQTTTTNLVNIVILVFALVGILLAGISAYKLYQNVQQGEQARGSNAAYITGLIIGSLLTILTIIVGLVTTYATGGGAG